jgi:hypothetical protein
MRRHGLYEAGTLLVAIEGLGAKAWTISDGDLTRSDGRDVQWRVDGEYLMRDVHTGIEVWEFNGLILKPLDHPENDEWLAGARVPLPVMMLAAGLI